jgi:hypothetical protein
MPENFCFGEGSEISPHSIYCLVIGNKSTTRGTCGVVLGSNSKGKTSTLTIEKQLYLKDFDNTKIESATKWWNTEECGNILNHCKYKYGEWMYTDIIQWLEVFFDSQSKYR